ncbi:MAG: UDP-N-acetylmuramoyl-tripeptide--D-alanyl-D-alanine ligase [Bacilli bacterium]|nr:UDP-N-acetylmuramoyl-tripeptide--D-alanyl-D-alanine ligase [Bacilli bacterium]
MHNIYVKDILNLCNGELLIGNKDLILENFSKDTRDIKEGDTYIAIKGESFDGNQFIDKAFTNGASCCIIDTTTPIDINKYNNKTIIKVKDSIKCLQELAKYKRSLYNIPVIAITGSVGKTSTKDIVYEVVSKKYKTLKPIGNFNNHIGLPFTILGLKDHEALVVEMGMNHLKEISLLTSIAKPTIAIITNIGTAHIGNLGSRENILKAKLEITESLSNNNTLIINNDDDLLNKEAPNLQKKYNLVTIGINNKSNYMATNIKENVFSSTFKINNNDININVGSKAFIYNSLVAYAVGNLLNINPNDISKALSEFKLSEHRLEKKITNNGITIIDDTYNANQDSMINSLSLLSKVKNKRRVAVLGDILELGEFSKEIHQNIGKTIKPTTLDILVIVGNDSQYIKEEALKNNFNSNNIYKYKDYKEAISKLPSILKKDDIVLLKASHGMNLVKVVDSIIN